MLLSGGMQLLVVMFTKILSLCNVHSVVDFDNDLDALNEVGGDECLLLLFRPLPPLS